MKKLQKECSGPNVLCKPEGKCKREMEKERVCVFKTLPMCMCVWNNVRVWERKWCFVCVCVCEREREKEKESARHCLHVFAREYVSVLERERERECLCTYLNWDIISRGSYWPILKSCHCLKRSVILSFYPTLSYLWKQPCFCEMEWGSDPLGQ